MIAFAVLCVYITFCLLFWQGQWQLVFKPSRNVPSTPASIGLRFSEIAFDTTETGIPQLHGWWIPADQATAKTLLFMHGGAGSLSDTLPQLQALHGLGVNLFAFDYRGFGNSQNMHPSERTTYEDADAAWRYLTQTRRIPASAIVLGGVGVGAVVAAETARRHLDAPALILQDVPAPTLEMLQFDPRTPLLPIRLLFHDRFDPTRTLAQLRTPKLFVYSANAANGRYYEQASEPKQQVTASDYLPTVRSFLAKYLAVN